MKIMSRNKVAVDAPSSDVLLIAFEEFILKNYQPYAKEVELRRYVKLTLELLTAQGPSSHAATHKISHTGLAMSKKTSECVLCHFH